MRLGREKWREGLGGNKAGREGRDEEKKKWVENGREGGNKPFNLLTVRKHFVACIKSWVSS